MTSTEVLGEENVDANLCSNTDLLHVVSFGVYQC